MATAWIAGGTGLVGGVLLRRLVQEAFLEKVVALGRRNAAFEHPKLTQVIVDFSSVASFDSLPRVDVVFSCLGTTIKKAGSRAAFRSVDHDAVVTLARAAREKGARAFLHVSALGADPKSMIFYNAVKGQVEDTVARVGIPSVYAFRPSILDGQRRESRPGERIGLVAMRALGPIIGKYRPTPVEAVAKAMIAFARNPLPGSHVVEADAILRIGT